VFLIVTIEMKSVVVDVVEGAPPGVPSFCLEGALVPRACRIGSPQS
jgi:hypothetical protein